MMLLPSWRYLRDRVLVRFVDLIRCGLFLLASRPLLPQVK